jgi:hypothetical protein
LPHAEAFAKHVKVINEGIPEGRGGVFDLGDRLSASLLVRISLIKQSYFR